MKPATRQKITRRLQECGLYYAIMPAEIVVLRWLSVWVVALIVLPLLWLTDRVGLVHMLAALALLPIAYTYVDIWLRDQAKRRKLRIEKDFPFFLDVLVLSMKAGLAFPGAIQQATTQLPDGPIKQELSRLIREVRTGTSRSEGLQRLALRVRLASVSNFVAVVAQADESGGSLTKALHEQARQRRRERFPACREAGQSGTGEDAVSAGGLPVPGHLHHHRLPASTNNWSARGSCNDTRTGARPDATAEIE